MLQHKAVRKTPTSRRVKARREATCSQASQDLQHRLLEANSWQSMLATCSNTRRRVRTARETRTAELKPHRKNLASARMKNSLWKHLHPARWVQPKTSPRFNNGVFDQRNHHYRRATQHTRPSSLQDRLLNPVACTRLRQLRMKNLEQAQCQPLRGYAACMAAGLLRHFHSGKVHACSRRPDMLHLRIGKAQWGTASTQRSTGCLIKLSSLSHKSTPAPGSNRTSIYQLIR